MSGFLGNLDAETNAKESSQSANDEIPKFSVSAADIANARETEIKELSKGQQKSRLSNRYIQRRQD